VAGIFKSQREDPRIVRGMRAQLSRRRDRLATGERPLGWKVGFGAATAMTQLRLTAPLIGYLTDRALIPTGGRLSLADWTKPIAEPEIAVHIGKNLAGGANRELAMEAIVGVGPAIELADVDIPPNDVEAILACNIYQRNVILGACDDSKKGGVLDGLLGRVFRDGVEVAQTAEPEAMTGNVIDIVRHVADTLTAFGEMLCAGQIIITGSIVAPLRVNAGEEFRFVLDPVGAVSVRFE